MNTTFKTGVVKIVRHNDGVGMLRELDTEKEFLFLVDDKCQIKLNDVVTFNQDDLSPTPFAVNVFPSDIDVPDLNLVSNSFVIENLNFLGAVPVIYFKKPEVNTAIQRVKGFPNVFEARKHILKVNGHA